MNRYFTLLFLFFAACSSGTDQNDKPVEKEAGETLVGSWQNNNIMVRMPDSTLQVKRGEWEKKLGIKPIVTIFKADHTFISEYRTPEDSLLMTSSGSWSVEGDTLAMIEQGTVNKYYYSVDGDTVIFSGFLDWDQDGEANDHYAGKQVRIKSH